MDTLEIIFLCVCGLYVCVVFLGGGGGAVNIALSTLTRVDVVHRLNAN